MKKKKKHIRFRSIVFLLLFFYLLFSIGKYIYTLPVKNIYIKGNDVVTDQEIIDASKLKNYPSIRKYSSRKLKANIKSLDLIDDVKVKKNVLGKVTIIVTEAKPLFVYRTDNRIYLSNKKSIKNEGYYGIPIVINYVPRKILNDLITNFSYLNNDVIGEISEIEYSPDEKENVVLDENRFIFRMNDTNQVYIDTLNLKRLNNYQKIIAALEDGVHGYIYLNSNRENASFKTYEVKSSEEEHED